MQIEFKVSLLLLHDVAYFQVSNTKRIKKKIGIQKCGEHTVRGKKSLIASPLDEATVERTFVSSMAKITEPLANLAIFPVSKVILRDPISNSSVNVSRTFVRATGVSVLATDGDVDGAKPRRPLQIVRKPNLRHVRTYGKLQRSGFILFLTEAIRELKGTNGN